MSKINISIPQPCHENWNEMSPVEKGKFCGACQKNVYDFTKASDRQIMDAFKSGENLCGRFLNTQLERDIVAPKEKSNLWMAAATGLLGFLTLGNHEIFAQEKPETVQTQERHIVGKPLPVRQPAGKEHLVSGTVLDSTGVLEGAIVKVKGTDRQVVTDVEGTFAIKAKQGEMLEVFYVGYKETEFKISDYFNGITIVMHENQFVTSGVIVSIKKRTFFGRIFHSIGNWFR